MKTLIKTFFAIILVSVLFNSCTNDDVSPGGSAVNYAKFGLDISLSQAFSGVDSLVSIKVKVHNVSTGRDSTFTVPSVKCLDAEGKLQSSISIDTLNIAEGLYNVELEANAVHHSKLKHCPWQSDEPVLGEKHRFYATSFRHRPVLPQYG